MKPVFIQHRSSDRGVEFWVEDKKRRHQVKDWPRLAVKNAGKRPAHVGALLFLLEEEKASLIQDDVLLVQHEGVASLGDNTSSSLGLPARPDASLVLSSVGTVPDESFQIHAEFQRPNGIRYARFRREGAFLHLGAQTYTLDPTTFRLLEALDAFEQSKGSTVEERFLAFASLKEQLPEGFEWGDRYLTEIRVEYAPSFKLTLRPGDDGEVDFEPEPSRWVQNDRGEGLDEGVVTGQTFLAPEGQRHFAASIRGRSQVLATHPLGNGAILVLAPAARKALAVVQRVRAAGPAARKAFLNNPRAYFREALEEEFDEETIESVFWEADLSDRVREIGIWQPRVLPWIQPASTEWLPPTAAGLVIDGDEVELDLEELLNLRKQVQRAIQDGTAEIIHRDQPIPATHETLAAVEKLIQHQHIPEAAVEDPEEGKGEEPKPRVVLIANDNFEQVGYEARRRKRIETESRTPGHLLAELLPHQVDALHWLQDHFLAGHSGAILADDMGLGKTLMALSFLSWLKGLEERDLIRRRPTLIIAPTGLLSNWRDEHDKHLEAPGLGDPVQATGRSLRELRTAPGPDDAQLPVLDIKRLESSDWVLSTYEIIRDYQHSFAAVDWGCVILDEAQKVKNPTAQATNAINTLKTSFRLVITGTPVENRLADLWSIADVAWPGRLGSLKEFSSKYESGGPEVLEELANELMVRNPPPFMKRRMKEDHLENLPRRHLHRQEVEMPPLQAKRYSDAIERAQMSDERGKMFRALHEFRQVSLAPISWLEANGDDNAWIASSARLVSLFRVLDAIHEKDEKALIFLESKEVQSDLLGVLQRRYQLQDRPMVINGDIAGAERQASARRFQSRPSFDVMLLSPKAGGVGLTLTAANHVIHLARWWNPAVEDQCSDRVYRIGQERDVHVYQLLAIHPDLQAGSFDVLLHGLLERKRNLSQHALAPVLFQESDVQDIFQQAVGKGA